MYLSLQIFKFTSFPYLEIKNNFPFYFFASKGGVRKIKMEI